MLGFDDPCKMHTKSTSLHASQPSGRIIKKVKARYCTVQCSAIFVGRFGSVQFVSKNRNPQARLFITLHQNTTAVMDSSKVLSLLDQLDDEVDDLEEALTPLLKAALAETSSKLPLLDKAKLYTLVTYAIESLLFCAFHPSD